MRALQGQTAERATARLARRLAVASKEAAMRGRGMLVLGTVLALLGLLFTLQGVGLIRGSAMSGTTFWSVAGPVIILLGVGLAAMGMRRRVR